MEQSWENPVQDPIAVQHLNNQPFIYEVTLEAEEFYKRILLNL